MGINQFHMTKSSVKDWSMPMSSSCLFCKVQFLWIGIQLYTNSYVLFTHAKHIIWSSRSSAVWQMISPYKADWHPFLKYPMKQWNLLLAEIFNFSFSAGTYHGQRVIKLRTKRSSQLAHQDNQKLGNQAFEKGSIAQNPHSPPTFSSSFAFIFTSSF